MKIVSHLQTRQPIQSFTRGQQIIFEMGIKYLCVRIKPIGTRYLAKLHTYVIMKVFY